MLCTPHPKGWCDGRDWSKWQEDQVDYLRERQEANVRFAWLKSSEGTFNDSAFEQHLKGCKEVGIVTGAYHFLLHDKDPEAQAEVLARQYEKAPFLPPMVDIEHPYFNLKSPPPWSQIVSESQRVEEHAIRHCLRLEALTGRRAFLYTGAYYFAHKTVELALGRDLFIAMYLLKGFNHDSLPKLPLAWDDWHVWQYRGDDGRSPGVKNPTDMNYFQGSFDDLCEWVDTTHLVGGRDMTTIAPENTEQGAQWKLFQAVDALKRPDTYEDEQDTYKEQCFNFGMNRLACAA